MVNFLETMGDTVTPTVHICRKAPTLQLNLDAEVLV